MLIKTLVHCLLCNITKRTASLPLLLRQSLPHIHCSLHFQLPHWGNRLICFSWATTLVLTALLTMGFVVF